MFFFCLAAAEEGRNANQQINAQHRSPIPFEYVHLLAFVVKLHNILLAASTGLAVGQSFQAGNPVNHEETVKVVMKSLFIPFLNAILIICQELQFPFDGYRSGFPMLMNDESILSDAESYIHASGNLPSWMRVSEAQHSTLLGASSCGSEPIKHG